MENISLLWANKIISSDDITYDDVPNQLKDKVASILSDKGYNDLIRDSPAE